VVAINNHQMMNNNHNFFHKTHKPQNPHNFARSQVNATENNAEKNSIYKFNFLQHSAKAALMKRFANEMRICGKVYSIFFFYFSFIAVHRRTEFEMKSLLKQ
jgi:hypothetical protein